MAVESLHPQASQVIVEKDDAKRIAVDQPDTQPDTLRTVFLCCRYGHPAVIVVVLLPGGEDEQAACERA